MEFRILGPLQAWGAAGRIDIGGSRSEAILAALILEAGRPVPVDDLMRFAWDEHPPATARRQVRNRVTEMRRLLVREGFPMEIIRADGQSFVLDRGAASIDLINFLGYATSAQSVLGLDRSGAVSALRQALSLWRGPALAGLDGQRVTAAAARLNEQRLSTWERCLALELELARHRDVLGELTDLVGQYPTHERFVGQLMLALYRSGRQADAIAAYVDACKLLAGELGIDPGAELQELYQRILRNDESLSVPGLPVAPVQVPVQLPADVVGFVGRAGQLSQLRESGRVIAVVGPPGVGKTALAVHFGHQIASRYPDGQLFARMRDGVLARFLRALGVAPESVPDDQEEAAALYRSVLAGKRVLVVVDDVASAEDVRPLVPAWPGCALVVTSRDRLTGLVADGAHRVVLDVLPPAEAVQLLRAVIGGDPGSPDELDELARACGHLPLALRIAAAQLADNPHWSVRDYLARLGDDRLGGLEVVRAVLDQSYARLPEHAQRMLCTLGVTVGADVSLDAASAAAGMTRAEAARAIDALLQAHLVEQHRAHRYRLHDLVREHAHALSGQREAVWRRLFDWHLSTLDGAARLLYPDILRLPAAIPQTGLTFADRQAASGWLEQELPNLLDIVRHAATHEPSRHHAWLVTDRLFGYFWHVRSVREWIDVTQAALDAATAAGDPGGCAAALSSQGTALRCLGRHEEAFARFGSALEHARVAGWAEGEARIELRLGTGNYDLGRLELAQEHLERSRELYGRAGYRTGLTVALANLAVLSRKRGLLGRALDYSGQALAHYREESNDAGIALALGNLALINHGLGRLREARTCAWESLTLERRAGRRYGQAANLCNLTLILCDLGEHGAAAQHGVDAVDLAREIGKAREEASALAAYATVLARLGRDDEASETFARARAVASEAAAPDVEAEALIGLAHVDQGAGRLPCALTGARRAVRIAREGGFQLIGAIAQASLAATHVSLGEFAPARAEIDRALAFLRETGARLEEGRALLTLGRILHATGDAAARPTRRAALKLLRECAAAS